MKHSNTKKDWSVVEKISREDLYGLVWNEPMLRVAEYFGVSSSYMARVCTSMNVPRPAPGYWSKLAAGKAPKPPDLPNINPWDQAFWSRDGAHPLNSKNLPKHTKPKPPKKTRLLKEVGTTHSLIRGAKQLFKSSRPFCKFMDEVDYLKPYKKLLADLVVTESKLDNALRLANTLYIALEKKGYRVDIASDAQRFIRAEVKPCENSSRNQELRSPWSPMRGTVVYIGPVAIGLTIFEISEEDDSIYIGGKYERLRDHSSKKGKQARGYFESSYKHNFATGRLCVQAYSPYRRTQWLRQWKETGKRSILRQVPDIVRELENATDEISRLVEIANQEEALERQKWEEQKRKWRLEEEARLRSKAIHESKDDLLKIIESWNDARRNDDFFTGVIGAIDQLPDEDQIKLSIKIQQARELIGSSDPLEWFLSWKAPEDRLDAK